MPQSWFFSVVVGVACVACGASKNEPASTASTEAAASDSSAGEGENAKSDEAWKPFTYAPGVTVEMPGTPVDAGVGGVFALKRGEGRGLSVQCMDSGSSAKDRADTLIGMRRGIIGERKLLSEKKIVRGKAKGMLLDIATETNLGTTKMHVLLLAAQSRLCSFTSVVSGSADDADSERFLSSAKVE